METAKYILNLVPFKSVPKTPRELWSGRKPSLQHKGCPALVLKVKTDNLELKSEVYTFIEYPKGTKGWLFYNPRESRMCLSAPMRFFLDEDYIIDQKSLEKVILEEIQREINSKSKYD